MALDKIEVTTVERPAAKSGPTSSADYNSTLREIINTFTQLSTQWNTVLQPLIDTLPGGSITIPRDTRTGDPNPFLNGLDGSQIYMDLTSTELTENGKYFSVVEDRPLSIKESFIDLESRFTAQNQETLSELARVSQEVGITTRQKQAIGARIFDPEQTSSSSSLDGLVQLNKRNLTQLAFDLGGESTFLTGQGVQTLTHDILSQLAAIQTGHTYNSTFNTLDHSHLDIHTHKYRQIPLGELNGINKSYLLPNGDTFAEGSLRVIINGLEAEFGTDYSEKAGNNGFDIAVARDALNSGNGDKLWIHYILGS